MAAVFETRFAEAADAIANANAYANANANANADPDFSFGTPVDRPIPRAALRFLTAGSVDDGKSTLIGRLLHDSRAILADQLEHLQARAAGQPIDLSLLTDGLEAEREQGITIDVAWRYFATPARKFIIADAPGHEQYTRNMVTAAAGSDAAVVLVDITKLDLAAHPVQLLPQTRRHSLLAQLLRVPSIVFAVNKIDAMAEPGPAFVAVEHALRAFAANAGFEVAGVIPVSALRGDNVTQPLDVPWYRGPSLLQRLHQLPTTGELIDAPFSLPVQHVTREGAVVGAQHRVIWGRTAQGRVAVGDWVQVSPGGQGAQVAALRHAASEVEAAQAGQSVGVVLDRHLDVSRGDWLAAPDTLHAVPQFSATLAWLDTEAAVPGRKYWLRHGNRWVMARLAAIQSRLDIHDLQPHPADTLRVNDIGHVRLDLQQPLPLAPYAQNRVGGALIVVDPASHRTSGALLVRHTATTS
ncbi:MAG: GTP-binding protein [Rubrivivax sp.]